jgi:hypothetical protein
MMAPDSKRLEELILYGKVDEALSLVTLEEIADAWCRYQTRPHVVGVDDDDPDWWAVELLMVGGFWSDELRVRAVLDLLVDRAQDDDVIEVVGAGPLEDFVKDYDEDRLVWIERRAASSARFRQALAHVWIWSLEPDVFARVERAAGVPLARPDASEVVRTEIVPGDLPGTIHIKRNGLTVAEIESDPEHVDDMIELLKQHSPIRRTF